MRKRKKGRPRTAEEIESLILKLAKDTGWGYCRILGELKKLGIQSVSKNTVKNILKRNGFEPGPKRGPGTWDEFLKRHASTLWQCDFFSKKIVSRSGLRDIFVFVFLHVETRRIFITPSTYNPDQAWMVQQAESFVDHLKNEQFPCKVLMLDNDSKYSLPFTETIEKAKIRTHRTAIRSPNTIAYIERMVQTIKQEVLDYFVVFGHKHMDYLCDQFRVLYHLKRPHQGLDNQLIEKPMQNENTTGESIPITEFHYQERFGGLLKSYSRKAA